MYCDMQKVFNRGDWAVATYALRDCGIHKVIVEWIFRLMSTWTHKVTLRSAIGKHAQAGHFSTEDEHYYSSSLCLAIFQTLPQWQNENIKLESCQGDSGGPLIATSTRHSNSTQKRLILLKSICGVVF